FALDFLPLRPADSAVDEHFVAVVVDPYRSRLRRSVLADRRDHTPVAVGEELRLLVVECGHPRVEPPSAHLCGCLSGQVTPTWVRTRIVRRSPRIQTKSVSGRGATTVPSARRAPGRFGKR